MQTLLNKKTSFTMIENCVLRNPLISRNARLIYGILVSYSYGKDTVFPGQERIAAELGLSERVVRDILNELRGAGLISWIQRGLNKPNIYTIEEIPQRIKDQYTQIQAKINNTIKDQQPEDEEIVKERLVKRRKNMKDERLINTYAGRIKGKLKKTENE
jgi:DNA-binding transcriptional regulator LsrR (DeoR family)